MTLDGNHLRLPNALVFRSVTLNYTRNPVRRFEFDVGVGRRTRTWSRHRRIGIAELAPHRRRARRSPAPGLDHLAGRFQRAGALPTAGWTSAAHDFLQVKSEAIRRVKTALEKAGMDMPEPIYRVQLTERTVEPAKPARASPPTAEVVASEAAAIDTRVNADLSTQVDRDRHARGGEDLLDADAPRE